MTVRRIVILAVACACANARTSNQMLGALLLPSNARPAMVASGTAFTVEARHRGDLRLLSDNAQFALAPDWQDMPNGDARATVSIPAEVPEGAYAVEWARGDEVDTNVRALYVLPSLPEGDPFSQQYAFVCVTFPASGGDFAKTTESVNAAQAQFAVAFVDTPEDRFRDVLTALDQCTMPTIVVADAPPAACERWFGPSTFSFQYGPDAFLVPAAGRVGLDDDLGPAAGTLARLRQDCETARWTVGLFARPEPDMAMRNEVTLFVDDALHVCIYGFVDDPIALAKSPQWAGWFEPPRNLAVMKNHATAFTANRKSVALQKTPLRQE